MALKLLNRSLLLAGRALGAQVMGVCGIPAGRDLGLSIVELNNAISFPLFEGTGYIIS